MTIQTTGGGKGVEPSRLVPVHRAASPTGRLGRIDIDESRLKPAVDHLAWRDVSCKPHLARANGTGQRFMDSPYPPRYGCGDVRQLEPIWRSANLNSRKEWYLSPPQTPASKPVTMPDIRALTGLWFWAAFSIILHHLLLGIVPRGTPFETMLAACGSLGMTAFFVLSGFIIHYNYHNKVSDFSRRSYWEFFVARFSRLYPLYVFLVLIDVATTNMNYSWSSILGSMPYFLTLSQSWFYIKGAGGGLLPFVFPRASIAWSISTEMLMYAFYPFILALLLRDRGGNGRRIAWVVAGVAAISASLAYINGNPALVDWIATSLFGNKAAPIGAYPFSVWLTFYSPYLRIFEFLIGAMIGHLFLSRRDVPATRAETHVVLWLAAASLLVVIGTFPPKHYQPQLLSTLFANTGYYPWVGALIYACARLPASWVDRFFSFSPFVILGEWSYSIYLFHIFVYHAGALPQTDPGAILERSLFLIAVVFTSAYILYSFIEMPGRKRLRAWLLKWPVGLPKAPPSPDVNRSS